MSADFPSAWNDIWVHQHLRGMLPMPNQTQANEPMRCEVCNTSKGVFEKHRQLLYNPSSTIIPGATRASLQNQISRVGGQDLFGAAVDSVRVCNICNVACNSQSVYNKHLSGKKHAAQISFISNSGPCLAAIKFTQPAWCELCKISCRSMDAFLTHLAGKKHLRNLELLSKSNNHLQLEINPIIGAQEKPNTCKDKGIIPQMPNKAAMVEDIEAKKRKLGTWSSRSNIRICTLFNVVCNGQTVFYFHLAGRKHVAMVKVKVKQEQAGSNCMVSLIQDISHSVENLFVS